MKRILILLLFVLGSFQAWQKLKTSRGVEPLYAESYVAIYGRDSCGWTQRMIKDLKASNVNYHYYIVDNQSVASTLHERMNRSGISTRRYNLPVVDVNGQLSVRPDFEDILPIYMSAQ